MHLDNLVPIFVHDQEKVHLKFEFELLNVNVLRHRLAQRFDPQHVKRPQKLDQELQSAELKQSFSIDRFALFWVVVNWL